MPYFVLALLAVGLLLFLWMRSRGSREAMPERIRIAPERRRMAFVAHHQIYLRNANNTVAELDSDYIREAMDRREKLRERHSWKKDTSFQISANGRARDIAPSDAPIAATAALFAPNGDLFYTLRDANVGGLFCRDAETQREERLLLKQEFSARDLALSPDADRIALTIDQQGGVSHIGLINVDGSHWKMVTGGDTIDAAPTWIASASNQILYQSTSIARDENGYFAGHGATSIQKLDMNTGRIVPICDDTQHDHLRPRVLPSGDLLFIRRPYEMFPYKTPNVLLDVLLFPFRLVRAIFAYLNFFSLMYTRKPLTSASGPDVQADLKNITLQGRRIDAQKALRAAGRVRGIPSLVPENWQLIRRNMKGEDAVIATHVATYDIGSDGAIFYSNGQAIFRVSEEGEPDLILGGHFVGDLAVA